MDGLSANKLVVVSKEIALLKVEIESLEESMVLLNKAVEDRASDYKNRVGNEKETRALMANMVLKEQEAEFKKLMDSLIKFWGLHSHNNPLHFNDGIAFGHWAEKQFNNLVRPELAYDGFHRYLDDYLKEQAQNQPG